MSLVVVVSGGGEPVGDCAWETGSDLGCNRISLAVAL